jgi:cytochrome c-type biogenesis protein CcmF
VIGAWWAYQVLGWGGYWGWDPVELAAFMPWLTGTAFLHSVMIQEKRGILKQWNMLLIILTYDLVIFGTFLTRSGVLDSVHAFAQSAIGPLFFGFIGLTLITSLLLLSRRWNDLKSDSDMTSMFSREALFLLNNLLFFSVFFVCFLGVIFPVLSEAMGIIGQQFPPLAGIFTGQKYTVGPTWYKPIVSPIFAGLVLLMGIAPLSSWRNSTARTIASALWKPFLLSLLVIPVLLLGGMHYWQAILGFWLCTLVLVVTLYEFWRAAWARHKAHQEDLFQALWHLVRKNRRRYGGYIIHIAVILMALGIIGIELFQTETQATVPQGGQLSLGHYTLTFDKLAVWDTNDGLNVARAVLSVNKDGSYVGELYPRREYYYEAQQPITIAGVRSTFEDDLKVLLVDWQPLSTAGATFKVYHNPLVKWLWLGAWVFVFGTLVAAWPDREPQMVVIRNPLPVSSKTKLDQDA